MLRTCLRDEESEVRGETTQWMTPLDDMPAI
jgi:hypothetical protein